MSGGKYTPIIHHEVRGEAGREAARNAQIMAAANRVEGLLTAEVARMNGELQRLNNEVERLKQGGGPPGPTG